MSRERSKLVSIGAAAEGDIESRIATEQLAPDQGQRSRCRDCADVREVSWLWRLAASGVIDVDLLEALMMMR